MKIAKVTLESLSPYSPSKRIMTPRKDKEEYQAFEERTWQERAHWTADKPPRLYIPPMAFKRSLETAAAFLRLRIPGKGKSEYTKHFVAGVLVPEGPVLDITPETLEHEWLPLSSRGKRGETNVMKCEPKVAQWAAAVTFYILDDTIGREVFEQVLREAGNFIGIGRFRPAMGGFYGRFKVLNVGWLDASP